MVRQTEEGIAAAQAKMDAEFRARPAATEGDLLAMAKDSNLSKVKVCDTCRGMRVLHVEYNNRIMERMCHAGLYKLNPVDPWLESAWFRRLNRKCDILVSKVAFKLNLYHYSERCDGDGVLSGGKPVGAPSGAPNPAANPSPFTPGEGAKMRIAVLTRWGCAS